MTAAALSALAGPVAGSATAAPVKPGQLATLVLSPATAAIAPGGTQSYTAQGFDAAGHSLGDVTAATNFKISPNGSCAGARCTASVLGPHTVTGKDGKINGTATLTVAQAQADLAVAQTVSNSTPYFGAPVTFTTTVTNTSTTTPATGITATVAAPPALIGPVVAAGAGNYGNGTWTIGTLAPGASSTLTITGDAGDVLAGTQTVTATVTAATRDPNPANNTAAASEASQPATMQPVITPDPNNPNPIDVCAASSVVTWYGSVVNTINPAAPPPTQASFLPDSWDLITSSPLGSPSPVSPPDQPYISFDSSTFQAGASYTLWLTTTSKDFASGSDPNYQELQVVQTTLTFTTTCLQ